MYAPRASCYNESVSETTRFKPAPRAEVEVDRNPESPWEGCVTVEAGWCGLVVPDRIGWRVEFVTGNSVAVARRIARNQDAIDRAVAAHGGRARVSVEFLPDGWAAVREYDWNRWVEMFEAKP